MTRDEEIEFYLTPGRLTTPEAMLRSLLAILHRDGGQYTGKVGLLASWVDAKRLASRLVVTEDDRADGEMVPATDLRDLAAGLAEKYGNLLGLIRCASTFLDSIAPDLGADAYDGLCEIQARLDAAIRDAGEAR